MKNTSVTAAHAYNSSSSLTLAWPPKELSVLQTVEDQKRIANVIASVQERERKLIGQELHDNVNQILSTVRLFLGMLQPVKMSDKSIREKSVEYILMAIEEIRKISNGLVMPGDKEKRLVDTIKGLVADIHFSTTIRIEFTYNADSEHLDMEKSTTLLRIVQEQLKNIVKYSKAELVTISLQTYPDEIRLVIRDNGIGFDPKQKSNGIGLYNIYDRARAHNGSVNLQTAKGEGCMLSVILPAA